MYACLHPLLCIQYQQERNVPVIEADAERFEEQRDAIAVANEDEVAAYYIASQQRDKLAADILAFRQNPDYTVPYLAVSQSSMYQVVCVQCSAMRSLHAHEVISDSSSTLTRA